MQTEMSFKLVVIGAVSVGKSSLVMRYVNNEFNESLQSTLGAVFLEKSTTIKNKQIKFQCWDTAGQQRYKAIARIYYKDCRAAIVVYDLSSRSSFQQMKGWVDELKTNAPLDVVLTIVGNKVDLQQQEIQYEEAKEYADSLGAILKYTSAKDGKGVTDLFTSIGEQLLLQQQSIRDNRRSVLKSSKPKKEKKSCC